MGLSCWLAAAARVPTFQPKNWIESRKPSGKTCYLRDNGIIIGSNDIWIAATALAYSLPLVTANERHFRRVPGLSIFSYSK